MIAPKSKKHPGPDRPPTERVLAHVEALIALELVPGASLPSEAALALDCGVSRLTIREALKLLAGRGLLDIGQGRRAIVREPDGSSFGGFLETLMQRDPKGLLELLEVRRALEIQSASLAASRISRAGVAGLQNALDGMGKAAQTMRNSDRQTDANDRFHDWDIGFHEALALASGNRMLASLIEALAKPLRNCFTMSMEGRLLRGISPTTTVTEHQRIFDYVVAGNARGAASAMRAHLQEAEQDIRTILSARSKGAKPQRTSA